MNDANTDEDATYDSTQASDEVRQRRLLLLCDANAKSAKGLPQWLDFVLYENSRSSVIKHFILMLGYFVKGNKPAY